MRVDTTILLLCAAGIAHQVRAGELVSLGVLPGASSMLAVDISADGSVVVGNAIAAGGAPQAFRWTRATGPLPIVTGTPGWPTVYACNHDGSVAVGEVGNRAFRWSAGSGTLMLGVLTDYEPDHGAIHNLSTSTCVSASGDLVAGMSSDTGTSVARPFVWSASSGRMSWAGVSLEGSSSSETHQVSDMSADGTVLVGYNPALGAFRASGGTAQLLVRPGGEPGWAAPARAFAVSDDGAVVVGTSGDRAFRWTAATKMVDLGHLPGASSTVAYATNGDGRVVTGTSGGRAFLWTRAAGMVDLMGHLTDAGFDVSGWLLEVAHAVSADGTAIAGWGFFGGQHRAFIVTGVPMPTPPCGSSDLFPDGLVNGADLGILVSQWGPATEATASDINRDGVVNGADLGMLLSNWGPCAD